MENEEQNEHDCERCNKVPSQIEITEVVPTKEYNGTLTLSDAAFLYSLKFTGDISSVRTPEDARKCIEFRVSDADGKPLTLDKNIENYFAMAVGTAVLRFTVESELTRTITGKLEELLGRKVEPMTEIAYRGCIPANDEIKQYLQEYKARGEKA